MTKFERQCVRGPFRGQTQSFGDVGSMSGLSESGHATSVFPGLVGSYHIEIIELFHSVAFDPLDQQETHISCGFLRCLGEARTPPNAQTTPNPPTISAPGPGLRAQFRTLQQPRNSRVRRLLTGSYRSPWQRRTNVWRKRASPARAPTRLRSGTAHQKGMPHAACLHAACTSAAFDLRETNVQARSHYSHRGTRHAGCCANTTRCPVSPA